jgi:8-oxo-dGTP diphosphatase
VTQRKHIRVVAALIPHPSDRSRFLVQQRPADKSRANLWEFPGGKVEPGETDSAALARECLEELDVQVSVGARRWGTEHAYPDLVVTLEVLSAELAFGSDPKPLGAQALRFCTPAEMRQLPFCEADLPLLEALERGQV